jgi:hypothetical protein
MKNVTLSRSIIARSLLAGAMLSSTAVAASAATPVLRLGTQPAGASSQAPADKPARGVAISPPDASVSAPVNGAGSASATPPPVASTIYRQVLPDGGTVYSDKPQKGARLERELTVQPPIEGNGWTTDSARSPSPRRSEPTTIRRRSAEGPDGTKATRDDVQADLIRAEMLLEDAKRRQSAGVEPLPGERTGTVSGKSRLNERYQERQEELARDVQRAQRELQQTITERNAMR